METGPSRGGKDTATETELRNVEDVHKTLSHNQEALVDYKTEEGAAEYMNETRLTKAPSRNRSSADTREEL